MRQQYNFKIDKHFFANIVQHSSNLFDKKTKLLEIYWYKSSKVHIMANIINKKYKYFIP